MPVLCPSCGARSAGQEPFCPSCGAARPALLTAPRPGKPLFVPAPPVSRRRPGWKALLVGPVLSLVVAGTLASVLAGFGLFDWVGKAAPLTHLLFEQGRASHHPPAQEHEEPSGASVRQTEARANERLSSPSSTNSRIGAQIEHSRHRSPTNFVVHLIIGLLAYSFQDKKPGLHLDGHALLAA
jgi:hypothetical protein